MSETPRTTSGLGDVPWPNPEDWRSLPPPPPGPADRPLSGRLAPWHPTRRQRGILIAVGLALLGAALAGSFVGPAAAPLANPSPPGLEVQLFALWAVAAAGAVLFALAASRLDAGRRMMFFATGAVVLGLGAYVAFGIWVPNPGNGAPCGTNCGYVAPYAAQGLALGFWGFVDFAVLLLGLQWEWLRRRSPLLLGGDERPPTPYGFLPPPPPPPIDAAATADLYRSIAERSLYWWEFAGRTFRSGFYLLLAIVAGLFVVSAAAALHLPGTPAPLDANVPLLLVGLLLPPVALGLSIAALRHFRSLWEKVAAGRTPERSWLATPPELAIRRWMEGHDTAGSATGGAPAPASELVGALTLLRFGRLLSEWTRTLIDAEHATLLLLGLPGIFVLAFVAGAAAPASGAFLPVLLLGPLGYLLAVGLSYQRARRRHRALELGFAPLVGAESWLEQSFWSRF